MSWIDKQHEARKLLAEVKAMNQEGIDSGEKAAEATKKMEQVQTLMSEVKKEKLEEEKAKLVELLNQYEAKEPEKPTPAPVAAPIADVKTTFREKRWSPEARVLLSLKMAGMLGIEGKALNEGTNSAGGFLVPPSYLQNLFAETRRQGNALRRYGWLNEHPVDTNVVLLPVGGGAASVGIVAENATKPTADQTYSQVTVNVFTWAGISKASKQLVDDSSPTVADLTNRELGSLLGNLEEQKIINGSGSGEPRGILNTTGINAITYDDASPTGQELVDKVIDAIVAVQTNYFASANGVLMHPRRLAFLQKTKDSQLNYIFNPAGSFRAPGGLAENGVTSVSQNTTMTMPSLLGMPVGTSVNIPTNLGAGTNQDVVIVGDWNEAHWFQRQDVTIDVSDTAGTAFEANQVWFRAEERAGFSAERYPKAFAAINGTGLVP